MPETEDTMPDSLERRRWDDIVREIDVRVPPAVKQEMTPYRLTVEETARHTAQLMTVVFGSAALGVRGMVERMSAMEGKIDKLIDGQEQRATDWKEMRAFLDQDHDRQVLMHGIRRLLVVLVAILGTLGTLVGLLAGLVALGIIKL